jgi:hypothetical protein
MSCNNVVGSKRAKMRRASKEAGVMAQRAVKTRVSASRRRED